MSNGQQAKAAREVRVGDRLEIKTDRGTCTLDTSASPKRMTIRGTEGPNRGKTILAIYEMKDASEMPSIAEPWFLTFNAGITAQPVRRF